MQRIERIDPNHAPRKTADLLATVRRQMGGVPNLVATLAHSGAALGGYLGLAGALSGGVLPAAVREQIALAVAGANGCDYCASAHTAIGTRFGVAADELAANLAGGSSEPRVASALRFARRILETRGAVADDDLAAIRAAGYSDEEVVEILAHVALNVFTNYFNHLAATEIDFPVVRTDEAAVA